VTRIKVDIYVQERGEQVLVFFCKDAAAQ